MKNWLIIAIVVSLFLVLFMSVYEYMIRLEPEFKINLIED